jgi:hypothetical protein
MLRRAWMALLLATAGTLVLTVAVPAVSAQAYSVGNYYKLVNYDNGACADIPSYQSYLVADECAQGAGSQKWLLESSSDAGEYKFHNQRYGGCITWYYLGPYDALCSQGTNTQRFALHTTSQAGYYKVVSEYNGQCMTENSIALTIDWLPCAQGDGEQYWKLQAAS